MSFAKYIEDGFMLLFDNVNADASDNVALEENRVVGSPLNGYVQPLGASYDQFLGYTEGGVSIDPGAAITFEKRQLSLSATNALLQEVKMVISTKLVFTADYGVKDKFSLPGQKLTDKRWFSSKGILAESNLCGIVYDRNNPHRLVVYYWPRVIKIPSKISVIKSGESEEVQIAVLRSFEYGSTTCYREDNDLGSRWFVNRYDPSIITDKDGTPLVYKQTIPIPIEPLGILMFPAGS